MAKKEKDIELGICTRCESVGRKPQPSAEIAFGPNGVISPVCQECFDEIEYFVYANKEDQAVS
jgi:hypothetical protein